MIDLIQNATNFIQEYYRTKDTTSLFYHNYEFTQKLISKANNIFEDQQELNATDTATIQLALLFSATGFAENYSAPYPASIACATTFFNTEKVEGAVKSNTLECLESITHKTPKNKLQQYVLDIYFSDYGEKKFAKKSSLLRHEIETVTAQKFTEEDWLSYQIELLSQHRYFTAFALSKYNLIKRKTLATLLNDKSKLRQLDNKEELKAKYKAKYKNDSPERSIQTLYRVALRNHIKLSDIADTKANILLSVNAIIISLVLANTVSKLNDPANRFMILPTIVFLVFSIISMIMSIKATQPNVTRGEFTKKDLREKNVNLAFFGNFHKMELEKYQSAFISLIKNKKDVYNTLTTDLYYLGSVLDSKYRLLRYTYLVFMFGIIISVITFALSFIYRNTITL
jgi:hypothetical protein